MPPWFFERLLNRPRFLHQTYFRALRSLSAAGSLPEDRADLAGSTRPLTAQALVVGGGRAGLAAGLELITSGCSVLVLETDSEKDAWWGDSDNGDLLRRKAESLELLGGRIETRTTCIGLYPEEGIAAAVGPQGALKINFEMLVIATGALDRPLLFAGNDLPGVMGVRGFEILAKQRAFRVNDQVGVFGAGAEVDRALAAAASSDVKLAWVAGPQRLGRHVQHDAVFEGRLRRATGRSRVKWIDFDDGERVRADIVVLAFSQPSWELAAQAGASVKVEGDPPVLVARPSPTSNVILVGGAAGHFDPGSVEDDAVERVRAWLAGSSQEMPSIGTSKMPEVVSDEAFVCFCEDVRVRDLKAAYDEGFTHTELLKRRTGVSTGPCQGKMCLANFMRVAESLGAPSVLPTVRPPLRPVSLAELASPDA